MKNRKEIPQEVLVYCHCCLRDDYHYYVCSPTTRMVLTVASLGISKVVDPVRCCACGNVRARGLRYRFRRDEACSETATRS